MSILFEENFEISKYNFSKNSINELLKNKWVKSQFPLIYIISNDTISEAYIGESTNALSRMINHLSNPDRTKLNTLHLIASDKFNKSATLDIENNLIKYLSADGKYKLQNGNSGLTLHNYYQKDIYYQIFKSIWSKLKNENLVKNNLKKIDNSDLFKYSPYKSLSEDQYNATIDILKILNSRNDTQIIVNGSSGTGKTILAIYLMKLLKKINLKIQKLH
jgi:DNA replication protein DnaC